MTKRKLTQEQKAQRYDTIVGYLKHWPYSPYQQLENDALLRFIKEVVQ